LAASLPNNSLDEWVIVYSHVEVSELFTLATVLQRLSRLTTQLVSAWANSASMKLSEQSHLRRLQVPKSMDKENVIQE
jgi:hypothetical protein